MNFTFEGLSDSDSAVADAASSLPSNSMSVEVGRVVNQRTADAARACSEVTDGVLPRVARSTADVPLTDARLRNRIDATLITVLSFFHASVKTRSDFLLYNLFKVILLVRVISTRNSRRCQNAPSHETPHCNMQEDVTKPHITRANRHTACIVRVFNVYVWMVLGFNPNVITIL